jgi:hypothetical protein
MLIERRFQPFWILALGLLMTGSLGVAYGSVLLPWIGVAAGLLTSIPVIWLWLRGRSDVRVEHGFLYVGRNRLELQFVGEVIALSPPDFLQRIRGGALTSDFLSIPNPKHGGVVISNLDESDPYRHWVISCKNPNQVVAAIRSELTPSVN